MGAPVVLCAFVSLALVRQELSGTWDSLPRRGWLTRAPERSHKGTNSGLHTSRTITLPTQLFLCPWSGFKLGSWLCAHREPRQSSGRHHPPSRGPYGMLVKRFSQVVYQWEAQRGRHLPQRVPRRHRIQWIKTFPLELGTNMETHSRTPRRAWETLGHWVLRGTSPPNPSPQLRELNGWGGGKTVSGVSLEIQITPKGYTNHTMPRSRRSTHNQSKGIFWRCSIS